MNLWRCSICGHVGFWGPTWSNLSSFIIEDEWPSHRLVTCSQICSSKADSGLESGEIALPKFRPNAGGYSARLSKERRGYELQPDQKTLVAIWNTEHPNEQIETAFIR